MTTSGRRAGSTAGLLRTTLPCSGHVQLRFGRRGGALELGDHEIAGDLRRLRLSRTPVLSYSHLDRRLLLPAGTAVGRARSYEGLDRADRRFGRYTLTYPGTGPLDQYAAVAPVAG